MTETAEDAVMLMLTRRAWLMDACLQNEPSKRITFNEILRHLLPSMSREFHSLSYYCMSHCTDDQHQSAAADTGTSVSLESDCVSVVTSLDIGQQLVATGDSDIDDKDEKRQSSVGSSWQSFCGAMDSRSITVNSGLAYHRLPTV